MATANNNHRITRISCAIGYYCMAEGSGMSLYTDSRILDTLCITMMDVGKRHRRREAACNPLGA